MGGFNRVDTHKEQGGALWEGGLELTESLPPVSLRKPPPDELFPGEPCDLDKRPRSFALAKGDIEGALHEDDDDCFEGRTQASAAGTRGIPSMTGGSLSRGKFSSAVPHPEMRSSSSRLATDLALNMRL